MMPIGPSQPPGDVLRAWRERARWSRGKLAQCILANLTSNSPLARRFSGPNASRDLAAVIAQYEDFNTWPLATALIASFLDACANCLAQGDPTAFATILMSLINGWLPHDGD